MSLKDKLNSVLSCWTASPSPQHSELGIEFEEYTHLDLNVIVIHHHAYLLNAFTNAASGRNNIVFTGQATDALNTTIDYCVKQSVPLHIMDMARHRLFDKQQKETILQRASAHEQYREVFDVKKMDGTLNGDTPHHDAAMDILDFITQHPMRNARQNILIVQYYHKEKHPDWLYDFLDDVTSYNRFCHGSILFLDANFD
ncbi:hypothetical protein L1D34_27135 [Vibrio mediterranei]|uniref:hypothetical protein n=1 Tax=Vibrio mediterranei TaxID=689 RepID=UPI001EFCD8A0|nr:hypothetical protein [Vibrio mediterranei]MCG9628493.1 hypothetical protein [Vibrio mediterranei]